MTEPGLRLTPMTETMRQQYWVNEVFEPIDAPTAAHCYRTVFPGREFGCVAMGVPDLAFDIEGGNRYLQAAVSRTRLAQPGGDPAAVDAGRRGGTARRAQRDRREALLCADQSQR